MRCSVLATAAMVCLACASAHESIARADQLKHPAGFTFDLPKLDRAWAQEKRGDLIVVSDDTDKVPELEIFVFAVKQEGTLDQIVGRLPTEVMRPGFSLFATAVKAAKVVGATAKETIADAGAVTGEMVLNTRDKAAFVVLQRDGRSLVMIAVPDEGIYERGVSNFRMVIHGLKPGGGVTTPKPAQATSPAAAPTEALKLPALPPIVGIQRVTASSTFDDKSRSDLYGAWRTVDYASVADRALGASVPATAWCEGKPDEGVGQGITIELATPTQLDAIKIAAGVWKTARLFDTNNHITALDITLDGKTTTVRPPLTRTWIELPVGRAISTLAIKIAGVDKGKMNDSCISGISFVRNRAILPVVRGVDAAAINDLSRGFAAIQQALLPPQRVGLEKLLDFPFVMHDIAGYAVGQPGPVEYATWKALAAACQRVKNTPEQVSCLSCPCTASDFNESQTARVRTTGPGQLDVSFPHGGFDLQVVWRLHWRDGAWHLSAIDYEPSE